MPHFSATELSAGIALRLPRAVALAVVLALPFASAPARAANFTVTRTDDQLDTSPGDGFCIAQNGGGCSLRAAVQEANALFGADGIYLPAGTYTLSRAGAGEDLAATGDLDVTSAITLLGDGWWASTIQMTAALDRIFHVQGFAALELGDVTLTGGVVAGVGGGVHVQAGGAFELSRSRIRSCSAHHGGAIGAIGGSVTVEDSELSENVATEDPPTWYARGPALASFDGATVTVRRSSLHGNHTASGTLFGISVLDSTLAIESSSIVEDAFTGAYSVAAEESDVTIVSSTLSRVTASGLAPPDVTLSLGCSIVGYCSYTGGNMLYANNGLNVFFDGSPCVGASDVDGEWNLFPLWAPPGKFPARVPNSYSAALDGGHAFVCAADDQWSQSLRPYDNDGDGIAVVDVGAVEASLIFLDDFESGGTWNWSDTEP